MSKNLLTTPFQAIEHRDNVAWYVAPRPRWFFHRHRWQTRALTVKGYWIERCSCGATHYSDIPGWTERER